MKWRRSLAIVGLVLASANSFATPCTTPQLVRLEDIARCAQDGDVNAQLMLAEIKFEGKEVPRNYKTAFEWMSKAAERGDKDAQGSLGFYYFNGWGTEKDPVLAYAWCLSLVNNEEPVLRRNIEALERDLSPKQIEMAQDIAGHWLATHRNVQR